jgi:hypothetical protein
MRQINLPLLIICGLVFAPFTEGCLTGPGDNGTPPAPITGMTTNISADGNEYPAYMTVPSTAG